MTAWMGRAACAGVGPDVFFADDDRQDLALELCDRCTVRTQCLQYALDHDLDDGVYGGHTEYGRRRLHWSERRGKRGPS